MKIGIDIDGVINDLSRFYLECGSRFCYMHHLKHALNPFAYEIYDIFEWTKKEYKAFQSEYFRQLFISTFYVRPFAGEVIRCLQKKHEIYIITGRSPHLAEQLGFSSAVTTAELSMRWLEDAGIHYDRFFLTNWDKRDVIYRNNINVIIEDSPLFLEQVAGISDFTAICFDANYNRDFAGATSIRRAYSWYDVLRIINALEE